MRGRRGGRARAGHRRARQHRRPRHHHVRAHQRRHTHVTTANGRAITVSQHPAIARRNAIFHVFLAIFFLFIGMALLINGVVNDLFGLIIGGAINLFLGIVFIIAAVCRAKTYSRTINAVPRPVPTITTTVPGYGFATEQTATQNQTNTSMVGNQPGAQTTMFTYPYQNNTNPPYPVSSSPYPPQPPYPASTQPYPPVNNDESAPAYTFSTPFAPPPSYESVTKEKYGSK